MSRYNYNYGPPPPPRSPPPRARRQYPVWSRGDRGDYGANHYYDHNNNYESPRYYNDHRYDNHYRNNHYNDYHDNYPNRRRFPHEREDYHHNPRFSPNDRPTQVYYNRKYRPDDYAPDPYNGYPDQPRERSRGSGANDRGASPRGRRQQQQQQQQQRLEPKRGPRQPTLNDYMPPRLRVDLPSSNTPAPATDHNTTQPFTVDPQEPNDRRLPPRTANTITTTTSSHRRKQGRSRPQRSCSTDRSAVNNRFALLANDEGDDDEDNNDKEVPMVAGNNRKQNKNKNKNGSKGKVRSYLDQSRIFAWCREDPTFKEVIKSSGNQAFILAAAPVLDELIYVDYDQQVWEFYLKMGIEQKHWAKEVVHRTNTRQRVVDNEHFVQKKIGLLSSRCAQLEATILSLQVQLGTYWIQVPWGKKTTASKPTETNTATAATTTTNSTEQSPRTEVDKAKKAIVNYLEFCTQHVKKRAQGRIQLAKVELEEHRAMVDFEQIATPLQLNIHEMLKPKMKAWSVKNKNLRTLEKQIEYDLPPKFITKIDFNFKLDESTLDKQEAQEYYDRMQQMTSLFRREATTLYQQSLTREFDLLTNKIQRIVEGFPHESSDGIDAQARIEAFKQYCILREKRMNIQVQQAVYFLDERRAEVETAEQHQQMQQFYIDTPARARSLGEDFLLQT